MLNNKFNYLTYIISSAVPTGYNLLDNGHKKLNSTGNVKPTLCTKLFLTMPFFLAFRLGLNLRLSSLIGGSGSIEYFAFDQPQYNECLLCAIFYLDNFTTNLSILSFPIRKAFSEPRISKTTPSEMPLSQSGLFYNYWWMEREMSELLPVNFSFKYDTRNLLMEYFIVYKPYIRSFPSVGIYELFYDTISTTMIHQKPSMQY